MDTETLTAVGRWIEHEGRSGCVVDTDGDGSFLVIFDDNSEVVVDLPADGWVLTPPIREPHVVIAHDSDGNTIGAFGSFPSDAAAEAFAREQDKLLLEGWECHRVDLDQDNDLLPFGVLQVDGQGFAYNQVHRLYPV